MARKVEGNKINYLRINKDGVLYTKSSKDAQGAVEIELKDGNKVYHELFNGGTEIGKITFMGIVEKNYDAGKVEEFSITIAGDGESDCLQIPLYTQRGGLNPYMKNIACVLPNLVFEKDVSLKPSTKKNDRGYPFPNIFFNYTDKTSAEIKHRYGKDGDIPAAVEAEKFGKKSYDFTAQDEYLHKILMAEIDRFKDFKGVGQTETSNGNSTTDESELTKPDDVNIDDLPF